MAKPKKTKPEDPKNKKIAINSKVYDAIKKKADAADQTVDQYTEKLLDKRGKKSGGAGSNGANSS